MAKDQTTVASIPGELNRELWSVDAAMPLPDTKLDSDQEGGRFYLETAQATALPLWLNSSDPELMDQLVRMELEKRKLHSAGNPGCNYDFRIVDKQESRCQVEVTVIEPDLESTGLLAWSQFDVAPRAYVFPENQVILWREMGGWTVAFTKGRKLAYYQTCGKALLDSDLALEIRCLWMTLQEKDMLLAAQGITVWDDQLQIEELQWLKHLLETEVTVEPRPKPFLKGAPPSKLIPSIIAQKRLAKAQRASWLRIAAGFITLYAVLIAAGAGHLFLIHQKNQARQASLDQVSQEAQIVRDIYQHWDRFRPAVDPDHYPVEIFHQCASILPSSGIRLTHFEINHHQVVVRGEASNANLAIRYNSALLAHQPLADYDWSAPKPEILTNNKAKFQAFGSYRYAITEEE